VGCATLSCPTVLLNMENIQLDHSHHRPRIEKYPVCFLAHDMEVPMNVGSLFRISGALGIEKIYLSGSSPGSG